MKQQAKWEQAHPQTQIETETIPKGFVKIHRSQEEVFQVLLQKYKALVEKDGYEFRYNSDIANALHSVTMWMTRPDARKKQWLLLCGSIGNGKSTMLKAIRDTYWHYDNRYTRFMITRAARIVDLYAMNHDEFDDNMQSEILGIDELGREADKDRFRSSYPIREIFEHRYDYRLPLICTTNCDAEELSNKYNGDDKDKYLSDRFLQMFQIIPFTQTESYRGL